MEAFNLDKVKAGAKVCTRDGRKVRLLATYLKNSEQPICAAVTKVDGNGKEYEVAQQYYPDGMLCHRRTVNSTKVILEPRLDDLMLEDNENGKVK